MCIRLQELIEVYASWCKMVVQDKYDMYLFGVLSWIIGWVICALLRHIIYHLQTCDEMNLVLYSIAILTM